MANENGKTKYYTLMEELKQAKISWEKMQIIEL